MGYDTLEGAYWARSADLLTAARAVLVLPLAVAAFAGSWSTASILLAVAWWSDFLDGRLARRSAVPTRLAEWDMAVDTTVGAGLMAGLVFGGHVPPAWGLAAAVAAAGFYLRHNLAFGMLLQAMAYGPALWFASRTGAGAVVPALATIAAIAVLDYQRLFAFVLPTFFRGILGRRNGPV